jgi:hypothetical protein
MIPYGATHDFVTNTGKYLPPPVFSASTGIAADGFGRGLQIMPRRHQAPFRQPDACGLRLR